MPLNSRISKQMVV